MRIRRLSLLRGKFTQSRRRLSYRVEIEGRVIREGKITDADNAECR